MNWKIWTYGFAAVLMLLPARASITTSPGGGAGGSATNVNGGSFANVTLNSSTFSGILNGNAAGVSNLTEAALFPMRNANQDNLPQVGYNGWPGLGTANATETNVIAAIVNASNLNMLAYYPNFVIEIDDGGPTGRVAGVLSYPNFTGGTLSNVCRIAHLSGGPGHPDGFKIIAYDEASPSGLTSGGFPCSGQGANLEIDATAYAQWGLDGLKMDMGSLVTALQPDSLGVALLNRAHAAMLAVTNKQYYFLSFTWWHTNEAVFTQTHANNAVLLGDFLALSGGNSYNWWPLMTGAIDTRYSAQQNIPNVTFGFASSVQLLNGANVLISRGVIGTSAMLNRTLLFSAILPTQAGTYGTGQSYFELLTNAYIAKIQQDKKYMATEVQKTANSEAIFKRLSDGNFALELLNRTTNTTQTITVNLNSDLGLPPGSYTFVSAFYPHASFVNSTNSISAALVPFEADIYFITPNALAAPLASLAMTSIPFYGYANVFGGTISSFSANWTGIPMLFITGATAANQLDLLVPNRLITTTNVQVILEVSAAATAGTIPVYCGYGTLVGTTAAFANVVTNYVFVSANAPKLLTNNFMTAVLPDLAGLRLGVTAAATNNLQLLNVWVTPQ